MTKYFKPYLVEWACVFMIVVLGVVIIARTVGYAPPDRGPHCVEWRTQPILTMDPDTRKPVDVWVPVCVRFKAAGGVRKDT